MSNKNSNVIFLETLFSRCITFFLHELNRTCPYKDGGISGS